MQEIHRRLRLKFPTIIFFMVLFVTIPVLFNYMFYKYSPTSYWFEYDKIIVKTYPGSTAPKSCSNSLYVFSYARIKQPLKIDWLDVLYCDSGNGFEMIKSYESSAYFDKTTVMPRLKLNPVSGEETEIPWRFQFEGVLHMGETCYIDSAISTTLPFGFVKTQEITSNQFVVQ